MLKVQEIRELIKLIDESKIEEFSYEADGTKVVMKKSLNNLNLESLNASVPKQVAPKVSETEEFIKPVTDASSEQDVINKEVSNEVNYDFEIESPMVGTFYSSPNPESDNFVSLGEKVSKDTVVCIVEAMKLFNEIEAETNGEIVEILVEDGELVEYGQPLFRVKIK